MHEVKGTAAKSATDEGDAEEGDEKETKVEGRRHEHGESIGRESPRPGEQAGGSERFG